MTNTSIADDLIYGQSNIEEQTPQKNKIPKQEERVSTRVVSTRYKMYVLFFLLVGLLLFYKFLLPAYSSNEGSKNSLEKKQEQVDSFQHKKQEADNNVVLLELIQKQEQQILECVNDEK